MRCLAGKWSSQPSGATWVELSDADVGNPSLKCSAMDPQSPLRPTVRSCGTLATMDVLVPLGVRFQSAPDGSKPAETSSTGNTTANCPRHLQTLQHWWAGIDSWVPRHAALFILPSPWTSAQAIQGAQLANASAMTGIFLAGVDIDPVTGESTSLELSAQATGRASAQLSVSRESTTYESVWEACESRLVAAAGHPSLRLKLQVELATHWLDRPFSVVAVAGAGKAQTLTSAVAVGVQSDEFIAMSWACQQLPFNVVAPHALRSGSTTVQNSAASSRLAIGASSPNAEMQFALPSSPAAGETLVVGCQSTVASLRFDHSRAGIDSDLFTAGGKLQVGATYDSSVPSEAVLGDVQCSFMSTSAALSVAVETLQAAQLAASSSPTEGSRRSLQDTLSSVFPKPPSGALFTSLQPVSVLVRLIPAMMPLVRDVLVRVEGDAPGNMSRWRSSALSQADTLLNETTNLPSAALMGSRLGAAWEAATRATGGEASGSGSQLASSGSSEVILLMRPGSYCLSDASRVLVGAAEGVPIEVAHDGSAMRLRLPKQSEACNSSTSGVWGVNGSWVELRLQSKSSECGWQGITILPDGTVVGEDRWTAEIPRAARIQPLCPTAAQRLDLVAEGGVVTLCLVGVEPSRLQQGGLGIDISDAQVESLPQIAVNAGYEWTLSTEARTLRLASGAPVAQALAVYFVDQCEGFEPPGPACVDVTATLDCSHGTGDACRSCSALCPDGKSGCAVCPGGFRVWPSAGYWVRSEVALAVSQCAPPSERRCLGWNRAEAASQCGEGFMGETCSLCSKGYFPDAVDGCARCPQGSPLELLLIPVALYGGLAAGLAVGSMSLFGFLQCAASEEDRQEALVRSRTAELLEQGDPAWRARRAAETEVSSLVETRGSVPRVACARSMAGRAAGRAAQLGLWSVLSLQTLVQVSRSLASGVPDVVARAFSMLSVFELSPSVAIHPRCLSLPELTMESAILIAVLSLTALAGLLALAVSCEPQPEAGARIMASMAAGMLPRVFAAASVSYVMGVNTIVAVLHCVPDSTAPGSDWSVMATNPFIRCGSVEHTRAWSLAVPAAVCVALGLPFGTWLFASRRSAWLLALGISNAGSSGPRIAAGKAAHELSATRELQPPQGKRRTSRPTDSQVFNGRSKAKASGAIRASKLRLGSRQGRGRFGRPGTGMRVAPTSPAAGKQGLELPRSVASLADALSALDSGLKLPVAWTPVEDSEIMHAPDTVPPVEEKLVLVRNPMLDSRPPRAERPGPARASVSPAHRAREKLLDKSWCRKQCSTPTCAGGRPKPPTRQAPMLLASSSNRDTGPARPIQSLDTSDFVRSDVALASCVARDFRPSRAWHIPAGQLALLAIGSTSEVLVASPVRTPLTVMAGSATTTVVCLVMAAIVTADQPYAMGHAWKRWLRSLTLLLTAMTTWLNLTQLAASGMLTSSAGSDIAVDPDTARALVDPLAFVAFGMSVLLLAAMAGAVVGGLGRDTAVAIACERCTARTCGPPEVPHAPVVKRFGHAMASGPSKDMSSLRKSLQGGRVSPQIAARPANQIESLFSSQLAQLTPSHRLESPSGMLNPIGSTRDIDRRRDRSHGGTAMTRVRLDRN